jgi:hypothetical protein
MNSSHLIASLLILLTFAGTAKAQAALKLSDLREGCVLKTENDMSKEYGQPLKIANLLRDPSYPFSKRYLLEVTINTCMNVEARSRTLVNPRVFCPQNAPNMLASECTTEALKKDIVVTVSPILSAVLILGQALKEREQAKDKEVSKILSFRQLVGLLEAVDVRQFFLANFKPRNKAEREELILSRQIDEKQMAEFVTKYLDSIEKNLVTVRLPATSKPTAMEKWKFDSIQNLNQRVKILRQKKFVYPALK